MATYQDALYNVRNGINAVYGLIYVRSLHALREASSRSYIKAFVAIYLLTFATYGYFFTNVGFTNHTFPHVWVQGYPSFMTTYEGRWFADILIYLTGGSGVPTFLIALASGLQILNGFVFVAIFRITNRIVIFLTSLFIALHPAFLDYYSYSISHVSLAMGDSLVIVGVFALDRIRIGWLKVIFSTFCFVLALATYAPKISLICVVLIAWCLWLNSETYEGDLTYLMVHKIGLAILVFTAAIAIYYISVLLTLTATGGANQHINSFSEIMPEMVRSYPAVGYDFSAGIDYMPKRLAFFPLVLIVVGVIALLMSRARFGIKLQAISIMLILTFPPALQLVYIINNQSPHYFGRILSSEAYFVGFMFIAANELATLRIIAMPLFVVIIYYFIIVGTQESNAAAVRNIFDIAKVQRIMSRVEDNLPDLYERTHTLVVIGELTLEPEGRLKRFENKLYAAGVTIEPFINYRQTEILNFFAGRKIVVRPTFEQIQAALQKVRGRRSWPAPESVFVQDGTIVILLAPVTESTPVTWSQDKAWCRYWEIGRSQEEQWCARGAPLNNGPGK
jgi:hypothetical protein